MQVLEVGSGPVRQTPLLKIEFGDYDVSLESIVCRYMYTGGLKPNKK